MVVLTPFFRFFEALYNLLPTSQKKTRDEILSEQSMRFDALQGALPARIALFVVCAYGNIAYDSDIDASDWKDYRKALVDKHGELARFKDGITDIRTVIRDGLDTRERQKAEWGIGDAKNPYTDDDYRRLDEVFSSLSSRLDRTGGMDAVQDMTLHTCAKRQLLADKMLARGTKESIDIASKLNTMNQKDLEAEQLRGKDKVATEEITIPGIVEALKRDGVSAEMSMEDAVAYINKVTKRQKYDMTLDAADHVIELIINMIRKNNDEQEFDVLPRELRFDKKFENEFNEKPEDWEKEVYQYLEMERRSPDYWRKQGVGVGAPKL